MTSTLGSALYQRALRDQKLRCYKDLGRGDVQFYTVLRRARIPVR
jgi:hypothetical protein